MAWLAILIGSAVGGVILSIDSVPPGQDWFDSQVLYLSILVLIVPSALAGWFVPRAAPYWGLVVAAPYLLGFGRMMQTPTVGADLSLVGFLLLLGLLAMPAGSALAGGLSRRALA